MISKIGNMSSHLSLVLPREFRTKNFGDEIDRLTKLM